ncbi:MAG: adenylate/guanylate cyclase domain-containing protein [Anaerolineales bacterium]
MQDLKPHQRQQAAETEFPRGTVTFLFTDIEGSTRLLQELGEDYASLLEDHREIARSSFQQHGGQEVDTQGDSFFVSFRRAQDALQAVVALQKAVQDHPWPNGAQVRIRMGLHTGEPLIASSGYVGLDVHRAARLAHAAHGGQVLLSPSTAALVANDLPEGLRLKDLGSHRLKDLRHPVTIHQLVMSGWENSFPPLRSLDSLPNNLPAQLTAFLGRVDEIVQVKDHLSRARLVTLVGPGGTGKTRLSLQVAAQLLDQFEDGVWFIELDTVETPDDIVLTIAPALRFSIDAHSSDLDPKRQLLDFLSNKSMLLVLDNFEHLLQGSDLLTDILMESPNMRLLVTSRERLNVPEEWVIPLSGMSFPVNGREAAYQSYSAVALFIQRARQVEPGFEPAKDEIAAIARICVLVDGLPLAIELAAAWIGLLSCQEIASEIDRGIDFLKTSMRGVPDRHKSIRAVFDRSWSLLREELQAGLCRLAVFRGGFRIEAASEVTDVSLSMLQELTQKSLAYRNEQGRFEMHPLLKSYAEEKLAQHTDEVSSLREAHCRYYIHFLEKRQDEIQGEQFKELRAEVRGELANVRSAMNWALKQWDQDEARSALMSYGAYAMTEGFASATAYYQRMADRLRAEGASIRPGAPRQAVLLGLLAYIVHGGVSLGDPEAEALLQECLPILRELDLPVELGIVLQAHGILLEYHGEYVESIDVLKESLSLLLGSSEVFMTVACQTWLGWAYYELGDYDQAGEVFQQAHRLCKETGNILGLPYAMSKLGTWADARQQYEEGLEYHREAQKYFEAIGDQAGQGYALSRMSFSAWGMEAYDRSLEYGVAGYNQFQPIGHRWGMATSLCRIGFAEVGLGDLEKARTHFLEALQRAKADNIPTTFNYGLIGFGVIWFFEDELDRATTILTLASEDPSTPGLYRDIAHRYLRKLEEKLGADKYQQLTSKAGSSELEAWVKENLDSEFQLQT